MVAYKSGAEIEKLIEEIHRARARPEATVTLSLTLTCNFEELRALVEHVNQFVADGSKQKWSDGTAQRALLTAMEALAAALPGLPPP
jgi:hypothetical protein